ncbi:MAG: carboxypeptidase-like regulatory domain-containing protein [Acidobacteriota bacterium]
MRAAILVAITVLICAEAASACSCGIPQPCTYLHYASDVIVSEVLLETSWTGAFPVVVVEVLKGELRPGNVRIVLNPGGDRVRRGQRLLQFREKGGWFRVGCCGPTLDADGLEHWLHAMRNAIRGGPPMLVGEVRTFGEAIDFLESVSVTAECGGRQGHALTNKPGQFIIESMAKGPCTVRLEKPGYQDDGVWNGRELIMTGSCAVPTFKMH